MKVWLRRMTTLDGNRAIFSSPSARISTYLCHMYISTAGSIFLVETPLNPTIHSSIEASGNLCYFALQHQLSFALVVPMSFAQYLIVSRCNAVFYVFINEHVWEGDKLEQSAEEGFNFRSNCIARKWKKVSYKNTKT